MMNPSSGNKIPKKGSTEQLLRLSRNMARDVLAECASERMCVGVNLWVFALLARITSAAKSLQALTRCHQIGDCFVLVRIMSDAAIAIEYILHHPSRTAQLQELIGIEVAVEEYNELKFMADFDGLTLEEVAKQSSGARRILKAHARAKQRPAFRAKRDELPKRWRQISVDEMYKTISGNKRGNLARYMASTIGNSFAHSGPIAIRHFFYIDRHGRRRFRCGTFKHFLYKPRLVRMLASAIVLTSCKDIVEDFHLSSGLRRRLFKLGMRVVPTQFEDGD